MKQAMINYIKHEKNDELYTPKEAIYPILKYLDKNKTYWECTDFGESNIRKILVENGFKVIATKKEEIDLASNYLITLRNRCGVSPVVVMQTNRGATSMDRRKEGLSEFKLEDLKESGTPADDSNVVLAIFNPSREKLASYRGYKVAKGLERYIKIYNLLKK